MSGEEWVKFVTQKFVTYIDTPKEQRRLTRTSAKTQREPWLTKWFGVAPMGIALWYRSCKARIRAYAQSRIKTDHK